MRFLQCLCHRWQHQTRLEQISWLGLLLFLGYLAWHRSFVAGVLPGPYLVVRSLHGFFSLGFWGLLLVMSFASFIFPVIILRGVSRRWLKFAGLALLGIISIVGALPLLVWSGMGIPGLLLLFFLAIFLDITWVGIAAKRFAGQLNIRTVVVFSLLVVLTIGFFPFSGYGFDPVDSLEVKAWNRSYHAAYMSFDAVGKLALYECGPTKLLCQEIYSYCNNLGSRPEQYMSLDWAGESEKRLTLSFNGSVLYTRSKGDVISAEPNVYSHCSHSLWD